MNHFEPGHVYPCDGGIWLHLLLVIQWCTGIVVHDFGVPVRA